MRANRTFFFLAVGLGVASALLKSCKPLGTYVGDQLIRIGEYVKSGSSACGDGEVTEEPGTPDTSAVAKDSVKANATKNKRAEVQDKSELSGVIPVAEIEPGIPAISDELEAHVVSVDLGAEAATEPVQPSRKPSSKTKRKSGEHPTTDENPKHPSG